jgi:hypothetical protein
VSDADSAGTAPAGKAIVDVPDISTVSPPSAGHAAAWHAVLLRMAGALPDDLISEARSWLADGESADVAQALAFAAADAQLPVQAGDATLMADELRAAGEDAAVVQGLEILGEDDARLDGWLFSPVAIEDDVDSSTMPPILDLTDDPRALAALDAIDAGAVRAVSGEDLVAALWRTWRAPADAAPWPPPRRVFIVSCGPDVDVDALPRLTGRLQEALTAAGEDDPQVEVCADDLPVPDYQSTACANAALLWAREPAHPIQLARVFDAVHPIDGPLFDPDHPRIDDPDEIHRLATYLESAMPVLTTSATMADIMDPEHPEIVPLTFRTDGQWIWTDTVSYYLRESSLAPEEGLLTHLRAAAEPEAPMITEVMLHRVLSFLQRPDDTEPVWVVPAMGGAESRPAPV